MLTVDPSESVETLPLLSVKISGTMGKMPDRKPRKTPDRVYPKLPEEEVSRQMSISLKPYQIFFLEKLVGGDQGMALSIQKLIERAAQEAGVTIEEWQRLHSDEKKKYLRGVRQTGGQGKKLKSEPLQ